MKKLENAENRKNAKNHQRVISLILLLTSPALAENIKPDSALVEQRAEESELALAPGESADIQTPAVKVREIREYLKRADLSETCMDEMVKFRGRLILKLAVKPVEAAVGIVAGFEAGAFVGAWVAQPKKGWSALSDVFTGAAIGAGAAIIYLGTDATISSLRLHRLNLILKALGEQALGRSGEKTETLYRLYLRRAGENPVSKAVFVEKLLDADRSGALCDGSMVPRRIFRTGLRARVATAKEFVNSILE